MREGTTRQRFMALCLIVLFSACSISYELILARHFALLSSQEIVWQSLTIAVYVLALGAGTKLSERLRGRWLTPDSALRDLMLVELALTIAGALSVVVVWYLHAGLRLYLLPELVAVQRTVPFFELVDATCILGQAMTAIIGLLSGFELPLLAHVLEGWSKPAATTALTSRHDHGSESTLNQTLACSYMGTLLGTFAFVFALGPHVSLALAAWWTAVFNLGGALVLFGWASATAAPTRRQNLAIMSLMGTALVAVALVGAQEDASEQIGLKASYHIDATAAALPSFERPSSEAIASQPRILVERSPYQTLHILRHEPELHDRRHLQPGEPFTLYLDRHFQLSSKHEELYHEFFVHYPLALLASADHPEPRNVLVLGGGDGLAARELLRYPSVVSVTQVELDPEMIRLATRDPAFLALNKKSLLDPRVRLIQDDAFTFLRHNKPTFDAIFIDFPYPYTYDLSRLYSREFYTFVRRALAPGGFAVADVPLVPRDQKDQRAALVNDIIASTFLAAGFRVLAPYGGEGQVLGDRETFMLALPSPAAGRSREARHENTPHLALDFLNNRRIRHLGIDAFPWQDRPELVNSVFRPTLIGLRNRSL